MIITPYPITPSNLSKDFSPKVSQSGAILKVAQELFGNSFLARTLFYRMPELVVQHYLFHHLERSDLIGIAKINKFLESSVRTFALKVFDEAFEDATPTESVQKMREYRKNYSTALSLEEIFLSVEFKDIDSAGFFLFRNVNGFVDKERTVNRLRTLRKEHITDMLNEKDKYNYPFLVEVFRSYFQEKYLGALRGYSSRERGSEIFQKNKDFIRILVKEKGCFLKYASYALRHDREIVLTAVKQRNVIYVGDSFEMGYNEPVDMYLPDEGMTLQYASLYLQEDKEIVLAAVQQHRDTLACASDAYKNNEEVVLAAIEQYPEAIRHASPSLQQNKAFILKAVRHNPFVLQYVSPLFKKNKSIVKAAMEKTTIVFLYASPKLQKNKELIHLYEGKKKKFKY